LTTLADAVPLILMLLALIAILIARALLVAARDHVRQSHPDWYAELGRTQGPRLGSPDERARRRLFRPLATRRLPGELAADPVLLKVAEHIRLALLTAGVSIAGLTLIVILRAQVGG
jgi:hypothetical protein